MNKTVKFLKSEPILSIAAALAVASSFVVKPDAQYLGYCNFEVLGILFCLMLVVAGLGYCNVFARLTAFLKGKIKGEKYMILCLTLVCFFSSAFITNDVALITFVPFTIAMLSHQSPKSIVYAVTMETVAANLGSAITPIGNPQNLFLYSFYSMSITDFFAVTLPLGAVCLGVIVLMLLFYKNTPLTAEVQTDVIKLRAKPLIMYCALFVLCIMSVLKIVPWYISVIVCSVCVLFHHKSLFKEADFILLLTFVCFFVFTGNMARIEAVHSALSRVIGGCELVVSALVSQVISNVPAAAMLASFTGNVRGLILGCNIGGLGTLIASMASLISYRRICSCAMVKPSDYLKVFTLVNVVLFAVLLCMFNLAERL